MRLNTKRGPEALLCLHHVNHVIYDDDDDDDGKLSSKPWPWPCLYLMALLALLLPYITLPVARRLDCKCP